MAEWDVMKRIEELMNLRRGKKSSITKRINELQRLISESGSRTKILFLQKALFKVRDALLITCNELTDLRNSNIADVEWLEEVLHRIDTCSGDIEDYMEARRDDTPSTQSLTKSWVENHSLTSETYSAANDAASCVEGITDSLMEMRIATSEMPLTHVPINSREDVFTSAHATHASQVERIERLQFPPCPSRAEHENAYRVTDLPSRLPRQFSLSVPNHIGKFKQVNSENALSRLSAPPGLGSNTSRAKQKPSRSCH